MAPLQQIAILIGLLPIFHPGETRAGEPPLLTGVFPPGATSGRDETWTLTGTNLARVRSVVVSGEGISVVALRPDGPGSVTATIRVAPDAAPGYRDVRLDGPDGASNALIVRVDRLPQSVGAEPDDEPGLAQEFPVGSAVAGRLAPLDRDHYRFRGMPGQRVALDLEVRRLGMTFAPVVTVATVSGRAIAQGRETRGGDRDCRMEVTIPSDGLIIVQVRDNLYGGGDHASYRLRVDPAPEPVGRPGPEEAAMVPIASGDALSGTIDAASKVARYCLAGGAVAPLVIRAEPEPDGSRLDPVVTVLGADGAVLAENDDAPRPVPGSPSPIGSTASTLRFEPRAGQDVTIEVADRFGGGGAGFGYRLSVGPPRPDFAAFVVPGGGNTPRSTGREMGPARFGVFNVRPGTEARVDFAIVPDGFEGTIVVEALGIPEGVRAERATVRVSPRAAAPILRGSLWIEVDPDARPGLAWFEVVATGRPRQGEPIRRPMIATVDAAPGSGVPRTIARFPIRILGP